MALLSHHNHNSNYSHGTDRLNASKHELMVLHTAAGMLMATENKPFCCSELSPRLHTVLLPFRTINQYSIHDESTWTSSLFYERGQSRTNGVPGCCSMQDCASSMTDKLGLQLRVDEGCLNDILLHSLLYTCYSALILTCVMLSPL